MDNNNQKPEPNTIGIILSLTIMYIWLELVIAWGNFRPDIVIPFLSSHGDAPKRLEEAKQ